MKTIELQQFFYGRDVLRDYGMMASSTDDVEMTNGARETCEAYRSPLAGGLPAPVLMTRVAGRFVFFDCIRNGQRDPSGRGTIFHHVLVGDSDALRGGGIDAFELFTAGHFAEHLPETKGRLSSITVDARPSRSASDMCIKLPAAIEMGSPDFELFQKILGGRSNCVSWVTYASRDMPDFELVGVSAETRTSARRWRYDCSLNVVARPTLSQEAPRPEKSTSAQTSNVGSASSPPSHSKPAREKTCSDLLRVSLVANVVLAVALILNLVHTKSEREENVQQPSSNNLEKDVAAPRQMTIEELCGQLAQKFDESYPDGRLAAEEWRLLTKESGPFYDYTDEGWKALLDSQKERLRQNRPCMLKVLNYIEFLNKSILESFPQTSKGAKK